MSDNNNDILHVEGGKPLNGTIKVRGAKNFVSKAMVAALTGGRHRAVIELRRGRPRGLLLFCVIYTLYFGT